jgi:hypothetical protein
VDLKIATINIKSKKSNKSYNVVTNLDNTRTIECVNEDETAQQARHNRDGLTRERIVWQGKSNRWSI